MKPRGRKGFTLIELMVVIAIILLLIAIFVPQIPAVMNWYRMHLSHVILNQLSFAVDEYKRVFNEYPHDTIWWDKSREVLDMGDRDCEYLKAQGYESLFLMLQGPYGAGWGPTAKAPEVRQFGPIPESPGFVGQDLGSGKPFFKDPFGRPVLYFKARPDSKYADISVDKSHFVLDTRYIYLVNFKQLEDMGTAAPQRGADELAYGQGLMTRSVAQLHWMKRMTKSKDASGYRYPYNEKSYVLWTCGADERFGYWTWSDEHSGFVLDVNPDSAADGLIGLCDDPTNMGD